MLKKSLLALFLMMSMIACNPKEEECERSFALSKEEVAELQKTPTEDRITSKELDEWDQKIKDLMKKEPLKKAGGSTRFYAYLYSAQKAFADESFYAAGTYAGNLDAITVAIIQLFYPNYSSDKEGKKDQYSTLLATALEKQFAERFQEEEEGISSAQMSTDKDDWKGEKDPVGVKRPSMKPWALHSADEFRGSEPPESEHPFWQAQLESVTASVKDATDEQKEKAKYWAKVDTDGFWMGLAEKYMEKNKTSLQVRLEVREKLAVALVDALIAVFDNKYTDLVKRPSQMDPTLKPSIEVPNHPSCPSAHSTICTAAEVVLSYYFPENEAEWKGLGEEAGMSRIWAGVHFPVDHAVGKKQGFDVGRAVIFR